MILIAVAILRKRLTNITMLVPVAYSMIVTLGAW